MRLASFNVENMFERVRVMNLDSWSQGAPVLGDYAKLNDLFNKEVYSDADKAEILRLLREHRLLSYGEGPYLVLRGIRGKLLAKPKGKAAQIVANGRGDWIGWVELKKEPIREAAIENTARVIDAVNADILGIVEAESRIGLKRFNEQVIPKVNGRRYDHVMLIDGNDDRGIDVGLLTRAPYRIASLRSHVEDAVGGRLVFSRDCPEYEIALPSGRSLWVLVNHLKSKGFGRAAVSNARRKAQAQRVRDIYRGLRESGESLVAVIGDLNDTPESDPLTPLLKDGSDLKDVSEHARFSNDGNPGTFGAGGPSGKLDYILLSPELFGQVRSAGVERRGVWAGKNGSKFERFPEVKTEKDAASDHAAIWAEIDI